MNDSTTTALLERYRIGEESVADQLFSMYRQRLCRMIKVRLHPQVRSRIDESDVLQDTFLKASQQLRSYLAKPEMPFLIWLRWLTSQQIQLCHRFHLDAAKRDARLEAVSPATRPESLSEIIAGQFSLSTPSNVVARKEIVGIVLGVLEKMKPQDREILSMRHFEQMTNPEVASALNISESNASTRYVRALARLQKALVRIPGFHIQD